MHFENEEYDNHCPCKEYPVKEETKQTENKAHMFQKLERFPVSYCLTCNVAHAQTHTVVDYEVK